MALTLFQQIGLSSEVPIEGDDEDDGEVEIEDGEFVLIYLF